MAQSIICPPVCTIVPYICENTSPSTTYSYSLVEENGFFSVIFPMPFSSVVNV